MSRTGLGSPNGWRPESFARALGSTSSWACDSDDVANWAAEHDAAVIWGPGLGLNGAIDDGVAAIADAGYDQVIISHADLPHPTMLPTVARAGTVTLVPDRRRDGTNVLSFPLTDAISASYGPGSFSRHFEAARALGITVEVRNRSRPLARRRHPQRSRPSPNQGGPADMAANEPGQPDVKLAREGDVSQYTRNFETPESALAIGAHPDDVEFGCGGLLAKWAADAARSTISSVRTARRAPGMSTRTLPRWPHVARWNNARLP